MLYLIFAMRVEAKKFIKHFNLKKVSDKPFEVYEGKNINLIISGVGKINSSAATAYLLKDIRVDHNDLNYIINIGICGTLNENFNVGDLVLINKIRDYKRKKNYYPDIIFKHFLKEGSIQSIDYINTEYETEEDLVDMESSSIFYTASKFLNTHQIHCLKVVSDVAKDKNNTEKISKNFVEELIEKNLIKIVEFIHYIAYFQEKFQLVLSKKEIEIINKISKKLKLTFSQKKQFENAYCYYKTKNHQEPNFIQEFLYIVPNNKSERDVIFESLKKQLFS